MIEEILNPSFIAGILVTLVVVWFFYKNKLENNQYRFNHRNADNMALDLKKHYEEKDLEGIKEFIEFRESEMDSVYIMDRKETFNANQLWIAIVIHVAHLYAQYNFNEYDAEEWNDIVKKTFGNKSIGYSKYVAVDEIINRACKYYLEGGRLRSVKIQHGSNYYCDYADEIFYNMLYLIINSTFDTTIEFKEYKEAEETEKKSGKSYMYLGQLAEERKDYEEAIKYYEIAALSGLALAQGRLGMAYLMGNLVPQNYELAYKWLTMASENGDLIATCTLGNMYENGRYLNQNYEKARQLYEQAVNENYDMAQDALGMMYLNGTGVVRDKAKAFDLLQKAANQGFSHSQYIIALMYALGDGVCFDESEARKWFELAAKDSSFAQYRDEIENAIQLHKKNS